MRERRTIATPDGVDAIAGVDRAACTTALPTLQISLAAKVIINNNREMKQNPPPAFERVPAAQRAQQMGETLDSFEALAVEIFSGLLLRLLLRLFAMLRDAAARRAQGVDPGIFVPAESELVQDCDDTAKIIFPQFCIVRAWDAK